MSHSILVLDSGVGGLSVLSEIKKRLPNICAHYLADDGFFPYGNKTQQELETRIVRLLKQVVECHNLEAIVIACNSASTAVLDDLREAFAIPFVGVVPAIKTAGRITRNRKIGLLATEGTVKRGYTDDLIKDFAQDCEITRVASPELVTMAEQKLKGQPVERNKLAAIIQPFIQSNVDTCVLGCTHFPWFKTDFELLAPDIQWIDSGEAIARRVESILSHGSMSQLEEPIFYFTGDEYSKESIQQFGFFSFKKLES